MYWPSGDRLGRVIWAGRAKSLAGMAAAPPAKAWKLTTQETHTTKKPRKQLDIRALPPGWKPHYAYVEGEGKSGDLDGRKLVRFVPVLAYADIDDQRHAQFSRAGHPRNDCVAHGIDGVGTHLKHQFVVHLHQHVSIVAVF
jgi:hypothetical protein